MSAVCTHPDARGRGYARMLIATVMDEIRQRGKTPFLHSFADNHSAIRVYESLGLHAAADVRTGSAEERRLKVSRRRLAFQLPSEVAMPSKPRLGQNFLRDAQAIQRIANALGDLGGETVIEIGPGQGAITRALAARAAQVIAIELDRKPGRLLRSQVPRGTSDGGSGGCAGVRLRRSRQDSRRSAWRSSETCPTTSLRRSC